MADKAPLTQILLYQTEDRRTRIEVRLENETVWLNQLQMSELFQTSKQNVSLHIQNIFQERELEEGSVVKEYLTTAADGKKYPTKFYNLDVIISVGYRVKSHRGTQFRIWATQRLREYLIKGFTLDDERLKQAGGGNYFEELLERIRDIRSSEKVFWRKVLDIYDEGDVALQVKLLLSPDLVLASAQALPPLTPPTASPSRRAPRALILTTQPAQRRFSAGRPRKGDVRKGDSGRGTVMQICNSRCHA